MFRFLHCKSYKITPFLTHCCWIDLTFAKGNDIIVENEGYSAICTERVQWAFAHLSGVFTAGMCYRCLIELPNTRSIIGQLFTTPLHKPHRISNSEYIYCTLLKHTFYTSVWKHVSHLKGCILWNRTLQIGVWFMHIHFWK